MIDIQSLKPGMRCTFILGGEQKLRKTMDTNDGRVANPLFGRVTRRKVITGNIAGSETYDRLFPERAEAREGKPVRVVYVRDKGNPIVLRHHATDETYVAIVRPKTVSSELFVDGHVPTPEQEAVISATLGARSSNPVEYLTMKLSNLENAVE